MRESSCRLTNLWSGRVRDKVPSSYDGARRSTQPLGITMHSRLAILVVFLLLPIVSVADARADYESALGRWRTTRAKNYAFTYQDNSYGGSIVQPCYKAAVRVEVSRKRTSLSVRGTVEGCRKGTVLTSKDYEHIPRSVESLFKFVEYFISHPLDCRPFAVSYDARYGYPSSFSANDECMSDSGPAFVITEFRVRA